jgi:hypothetical protein
MEQCASQSGITRQPADRSAHIPAEREAWIVFWRNEMGSLMG